MAEFKHIVRIANTDLKGEKQLQMALQRIKGVGFNLAIALAHAAGIPRTKRAGDLTDAEEKRLNDVTLDPENHGLPVWIFNRRRDTETGEDKHIIMGDIGFTLEQDKKREMKMRSYKGVRYHAGLPVRGQRTRTNARSRKGPKKTVAGKKSVKGMK